MDSIIQAFKKAIIEFVVSRYAEEVVTASIDHLVESKTEGISKEIAQNMISAIAKSKFNKYSLDTLGNLIK